MKRFGQFAAKSFLVTTTALSAGILQSTIAQAAIVVTTASAGSGALAISGTATANSVILLDGGVASATTDSTGNFTFGTSLHYIPHRCVVKLTSTGQPTVLVNVSNCGPITFKSQGTWSSTATYINDDLVFYGGTTWRAIQPVPANIIPSATSSTYWEPFAGAPG
ncbi:hypothetical protein, partial [Aestuariivirga sp.]|uniref:hypothetical protein n=1 Tax=Aestuariivirga sp. TaxID=2650926 RepID=UPI003016CEEF